MDESAARTKVNWREWGPAAFEEAAAADRPVLLSLSATWCDWCHEMDAATYGEPRIAANVNDGFVPVRVDVDRHPRVRERYNMGGFPSTVFCTPAGEVLTGATYLGPDGFRQVLERVREVWEEKGADAGRVPRALRQDAPPAGDLTDDVERYVAGQLDDKFDAEEGGWGTGEKFPLPRTVEFALKRERSQAVATLDAIQRGLFDDYDGGFFRYANARDWSDPNREKLLDLNASLLRAFAHGYLYTGDDVYRDVAERTVDYLATTLWTGAGFGGSQRPGDYYDLPPSERESADPPAVDPTVFAGGNALAADALLTFHAYTGDDQARGYAERALAVLRDDLIEDGVVTHYDAGDERGDSLFLGDQAAVVQAFSKAAQVLGGDYLATARAVADATVDRLQDDGAFADGPAEGPGLLDRTLFPVDDNALMADALVDLHALTGDARYRESAVAAVEAFAGAADRIGVQVAAYATAAARLRRQPMRIAVATDAGSDLHRAALRMADHEKVVVPNATGEEYERGHAYVVTADGTAPAAATPAALADRVAEYAE